MTLEVLSTSEMRCFRRCAREHHNRYGLRRRPRTEAHALGFGKAAHAALEAWGMTVGAERLPSALQAIARVDDPFDHARLRAMIEGYDARWADEAVTWLAVEVEFRAPLRNPATAAASKTWELGGKLDGLVRDAAGDVWILEHKTASEEITAGSPYWRKLTLDPQISNYYVGARALGYEPRGVLYDVLRKPGIRPLQATPEESRKYTKDGKLYATQRATAETPEEYYQRCLAAIAEAPDAYYRRGQVVRLEAEEREAAADAWVTAVTIREHRRLKLAPRNPDSCQRWNRECDYLPVCCGERSIDSDLWYRTADAKHEELSEGGEKNGSAGNEAAE